MSRSYPWFREKGIRVGLSTIFEKSHESVEQRIEKMYRFIFVLSYFLSNCSSESIVNEKHQITRITFDSVSMDILASKCDHSMLDSLIIKKDVQEKLHITVSLDSEGDISTVFSNYYSYNKLQIEDIETDFVISDPYTLKLRIIFMALKRIFDIKN